MGKMIKENPALTGRMAVQKSKVKWDGSSLTTLIYNLVSKIFTNLYHVQDQ